MQRLFSITFLSLRAERSNLRSGFDKTIICFDLDLEVSKKWEKRMDLLIILGFLHKTKQSNRMVIFVIASEHLKGATKQSSKW